MRGSVPSVSFKFQGYLTVWKTVFQQRPLCCHRGFCSQPHKTSR